MRPRWLAAPLVVAALAFWARPASAQYYAPQDYYGQPRITGALRIGLDVPSGHAFGDVRQRELFDPQLGLVGELGVRVSPQVTLGGYLGVGFGEVGPYFEPWCGTGTSGNCGAFSFRAGFMGQYNFAPFANVSPWVGYGFGFTASVATGDNPDFSYSYAGFDLAHLMAGIDLRPAGRGIGIGFYVDYSVGLYRAYHWEEGDLTVADGSLGNSEIHHWFSFGPRLSF